MRSLQILMVLSFLGPFARAMEAGPKAVIEDIFAKARQVSVSHDVKLQQSINTHVDFEKMAKAAMGAQYDKLSPADQKWFISTLRQIVTKTVYPEAPDFLKNVSISYRKTQDQGRKAKVRSVVKKRGEETDVAYQLEKSASGWKVVDISIDDESWVETIHDEVSDILQTEKWAGLKKHMQKRLAKLNGTKKKDPKSKKKSREENS